MMKLRNLVSYFRSGGSYEAFCESQSLSIGTEFVEVYMKKPFNIENELAFFEIEDTEGKVEYDFNDIKYFNLFDFYYFLDAIAESKTGENAALTDDDLTVQLYNYAMNDA